MINLDDRALIEWDESEMFFMLHLTRRLNTDDTCFPAIQTIANDTKWSKRKVLQVKSRCIEKGILSSTARFDEKGSQRSNLYTVKTNMLAVYVNMQGKGGEEGVQKTIPPPCKKRTPPSAKNIPPTHAKNDTLSINQLEVLKSEVLVNTPAPEKSFELQSEKEETPPTPAPPPSFNPRGKKVYESHLQIYDDLMTLWKTDELRLGTLKAIIDPLGINDNTPDKKIAFAEYIKDIYCASIKLNTPFAISPVDVHDKVIQKIGYSKDEIKALKPIKAQVATEQKNIAQKENKVVDEKVVLAYCSHLVKETFKTIAECMSHSPTAKRLAMKAMDDIEGTRIYLSEKNIAYECV